MVYLYDVVDIADLIEGIDAGLISEKHSDDGYSIFNYTNAAVYTPGAWDNYAVQQCRGLIVDDSNEIVARPWTKFFNHNQPEAGELEIFNKYIRDNYNVRFVLDDRNSVVEMWRNLGLTCLQVDEGNF